MVINCSFYLQISVNCVEMWTYKYRFQTLSDFDRFAAHGDIDVTSVNSHPSEFLSDERKSYNAFKMPITYNVLS